jgi:hypothetical protein
MGEVSSTKTKVTLCRFLTVTSHFNQNTRPYTAEGLVLYKHGCENIKYGINKSTAISGICRFSSLKFH